jgi:hypothetical protein
MITQDTDGMSRDIWANGLNADLKSFTLEVFVPALPSVSLTNWALSHIGILEEYAPFWNVETDTNSWEPQNLIHNNNLWVLLPGVFRQGFTVAIMDWVESPWNSSDLYLVARILGSNREVVDGSTRMLNSLDSSMMYLGEGYTHLLYLLFSITPPLFTFFET